MTSTTTRSASNSSAARSNEAPGNGTERTSEFYASGRLLYGEDGEPKSFDGIGPVADYARERGRAVLVIVPVKSVPSLMRWSPVPTEMIGDNGANAVVAVHGEAR